MKGGSKGPASRRQPEVDERPAVWGEVSPDRDRDARERCADVVCVLGCRPGSAALARRAVAARDAFVRLGASLLVTCGGTTWSGRVEADELARMLRDGGVPDEAIVRERASRNTHENATFSARLLADRGLRDVVLVTCSWHVPRARMLFERAGLRVVAAVGAPPPNPGLLQRAWWPVRERFASAKDLLRG